MTPPEQPDTPAVLPAPHREAVGRFLTACLEIFHGRRSMAQLRALASPVDGDCLTGLLDAAQRLHHAIRATGQGTTVRLRRTRLQQPRPGVIELAAILQLSHPTRMIRAPRPAPGRRRGPMPVRPDGNLPTGVRDCQVYPVLALACRLERHQGRWLCTAARLL